MTGSFVGRRWMKLESLTLRTNIDWNQWFERAADQEEKKFIVVSSLLWKVKSSSDKNDFCQRLIHWLTTPPFSSTSRRQFNSWWSFAHHSSCESESKDLLSFAFKPRQSSVPCIGYRTFSGSILANVERIASFSWTFSNSSDRRFESIRGSDVLREGCGGVGNSFFFPYVGRYIRADRIWFGNQSNFPSRQRAQLVKECVDYSLWRDADSFHICSRFSSLLSIHPSFARRKIYIYTSLLPILLHYFQFTCTNTDRLKAFHFLLFDASISNLSTFVSSLTIRRSLSPLDIFSLSILFCRCPSPTMMKFPSLSKQLTLLLIVLVLKLSIDFSQSATDAHRLFDGDAMVEEDNSGDSLQRRADDLQKLRHFLLTSNAEQRAIKRQQQDLSKRELVSDHPKHYLWIICSSVLRYANIFDPWKTRILLKQNK